MRFKKILSMTLILCMLMGLFPMSVQAADSTAATGDLFLNKTAILENDGTYTIQLEAYATGTPVRTQVKTGKALQIVIAVDQSGSMVENLESLRNAIAEFVEIVAANGRSFNVQHKIAIVGFASDEDDSASYNASESEIAGGSTSEWVNTGLFDSNGEFHNYISGTAVYSQYTGILDGTDTYYVKLSNGAYSKLTYYDSLYNVVVNPVEDRTDLYANVEGEYVSVTGVEKKAYIRLDDNALINQNNTYYIEDEAGEKVAITYGECCSREAAIYNPKTNRNGSGTTYKKDDILYIVENGVFTKLVCSSVSGKGNKNSPYKYTWENTSGVEVELTKGSTWIYKSTQGWHTEDSVEEVIITNSTPIYEYENNSYWYYIDERGQQTEVKDGTALYEYLGNSVWAYQSVTGQTVVWDKETVYTREGGELEATDYRDALVPITDGENGQGAVRQSVLTSIGKLNASGATRTSYGLEMANKIFESNHYLDDEHGHVVIMFTDGEPGFNASDGYEDEANTTLANANYLKTTYDASVYTVGLYNSSTSSKVNNFMNGVSSNYENVSELGDITSSNKVSDKYYQNTSSLDELNGIFTNITVDSTTTSTTVELDETAILRDILGTGVELMQGSTITAVKVPGSKESDDADIVWDTNHNVSIGTVTIDTPLAEFTNDSDSNIKLYNLNKNLMGDSGEYHPHTVDVSGFDYCGNYIATGKDGYKLVVTITGVEASPYAIWNQAMFTNNDYSGIWTPQTETQDRELKASFVQPTTLLTSTNYVVDYAKPFTMNVADDLGMSAITHLDSDDTNKFSEAKTTISDKFGSISKTGTTTLQYTPKNMNWSDVESFYVFGKTENEFILAQTANEVYRNLWSRVNVIPANNVYYEDTFVTDESAGTVGIEYSGDWTTDGSASGNTETVNGAVHGWEDSLSNDTGYSDGSAHKSDTVGATATFTFTGTGVDIYSRTDMKTGIVMAMLVEGDSMTQQGANGNTVNKPVKKLLMVDCLGASEEGNPYYQIPTLSFEDLNYGTYTVKIVVSRAISRDPETNEVIEGTARSTYYLDGIRVYNPVDNINSFVQDAYGEEINAMYAEVRDSLLAAEDFGSGDGVSGAVYVDEDGDGKIDEDTSDTGTFEVFGSKNEVYLKKGQMIAFSVNYDENARYFVGLKSVEGASLDVNITGEAKKIAHSTDLYYEVSKEQLAENGGIITIMNNGEKVLAVTKLRLTNVSQTASASLFSLRPEAELAAYARSLDMSEPEEPTTPEVDIENPEITEERDPELDSVVDKLFTDIYSWF